MFLFLSLFSCKFDDQLNANFHRFDILWYVGVHQVRTNTTPQRFTHRATANPLLIILSPCDVSIPTFHGLIFILPVFFLLCWGFGRSCDSEDESWYIGQELFRSQAHPKSIWLGSLCGYSKLYNKYLFPWKQYKSMFFFPLRFSFFFFSLLGSKSFLRQFPIIIAQFQFSFSF